MRSSGWYSCKDCQARFFVSDHEIAYDLRLGRKPRQRCESCVESHRQRVEVLARSNFPIPNARNGDGCFESLTIADLEPPALPRRSVTISVPNENETKHIYRYLLLEPAWIHRPAQLLGMTRYPWRSIATTTRIPHPDSIRFSVEGQMIGAAHIRRTPEGIILWWLDSLPVHARYQNAQFALPCYAIAESIQSGHQGRILLRRAVHLAELYESLGCRPTGKRELVELPREAALHLALRVEGVSPESIAILERLDAAGAMDLGWIVAHLGKGRLKALEIDALTQLMPDTIWLDIQRIVREPDTIEDTQSLLIIQNLCHLFGAIAVRNRITRWAKRATFTWSDVRPAINQQVRLPRKIWIDLRDSNETEDTITKQKAYLPIDTPIEITTRVWSPADYETDSAAVILEQIPRLGHQSSHRILAVSDDFDRRPTSLQKILIQRVTIQHMHIWVLPFSAQAIRYTVRRWLRQLGSSDTWRESDHRMSSRIILL